MQEQPVEISLVNRSAKFTCPDCGQWLVLQSVEPTKVEGVYLFVGYCQEMCNDDKRLVVSVTEALDEPAELPF